jgi:hypothetical protein
MASTSEVGHAKNAAHFATLITFCTSYGTTYNPSNNAIKVAALNTISTNAQAAINNVTTSLAANTTAINSRIAAFQGIKKLSTRMLSALVASGATAQQKANAKTINRKIQGSRAKLVPTPTPTGGTTGGTATGTTTSTSSSTEKSSTPPSTQPVPTPISVSQQSYDNLIQHFQAFIALLQTIPSYNPNETDLKIAALNTYSANLTSTNNAAITAHTSLNNTRIARNKILYTPVTGLCDIAEEVKNYLKSVYGATAPEYKQVRALKFVKHKL